MKQTPEPNWQVPIGEEGIPRDLLAVREALRALPRVSCPVGLDYRLYRQIEDIAGGKAPRRMLGWGLAWVGAGLGFAAAVSIGLIVFSPVTGTNGSLPMASSGKAAQTQQVASELKQTPPAQHDSKLASPQPTDQFALQDAKTTASHDSQSVKAPVDLPTELYHTVGGNEP